LIFFVNLLSSLVHVLTCRSSKILFTFWKSYLRLAFLFFRSYILISSTFYNNYYFVENFQFLREFLTLFLASFHLHPILSLKLSIETLSYLYSSILSLFHSSWRLCYFILPISSYSLFCFTVQIICCFCKFLFSSSTTISPLIMQNTIINSRSLWLSISFDWIISVALQSDFLKHFSNEFTSMSYFMYLIWWILSGFLFLKRYLWYY
jgi:hypothetical protein